MNRGSEWRIWDLHVHTPDSLVNHYRHAPEENVWDKYIDALEHLPKDIKVLGINDYIFIDGYKKVLEYKAAGRLKNIDLILPVVELRLSKFCGNEKFKKINYHVIFSDELSPEQIQQQFLDALSSKYIIAPDIEWNGVVTRENLKKLGKMIIDNAPESRQSQFSEPLIEGFNNLTLELSDIQKVLETYIFKGKYITAIGKTEWDDFKWNDNSIAEKKNIIFSSDIVFTAAENVEKFNMSKDKLKEQNVNDLLLDCSDAHCFSDETANKDRLGNCYTWIKADTTFEGLKQILYEPDERVRVQVTKPDEKNMYQVIDNIILDEEGFWQGTIPLNPNLNTIIGGRSTGKSSLLKAIAAKHNNPGVKEDDFIYKYKHLNGVSINWRDKENPIGHEIEYFGQGYIHEMAVDPDKTNQLIGDIIRQKDSEDKIKGYRVKGEKLSMEISEKVLSVFLINKRIGDLRRSITEKGKKEGVIHQLDLLKEKVAALQKDAKLNLEEQSQIMSYRLLITEKKGKISSAEHDLIIFDKLLKNSPLDSTYEENMQLGELAYGKNGYEIQKIYKEFKNRAEEEWSSTIRKLITETASEKEKLSSEILDIESSDLYKKGVRIFEGNKEMKDLNLKIQEEEKVLAEIERLQYELDKTVQRQETLINEVIDQHCSYKKEANSIAKSFSKSFEDLEININVKFHNKDLREFLEHRLNMRGYDRQEYVQDLLEGYDDNNEKYCRNFLKNLLEGNITLKNEYDARNVAGEFFPHNWYSFDYEIIYQSDTFATMSEGKQAFVILKLLLDFGEKKCPILIDQPEDSLDNRAIYNELVEYIKSKKHDRQIILVTHNPNVVVGADAENVIVANQNGTNAPNKGGVKFKYINGALENTKRKDDSDSDTLFSQGIREHICDILEGGRNAFEKRERKYGFKR